MQSKKKMIVNTVFLVVIFALTIYGVFHGEDLGAMMEAMRRADVRWRYTVFSTAKTLAQ